VPPRDVLTAATLLNSVHESFEEMKIVKTKNLPLTSVLTVLLCFSAPALAGKPGNVPEVIVTSTIDGSGIVPDPTVPNYRLQSDLLGDYYHGVDRVVSHLQGGAIGTGAGDWEMDTADSPVRRLTLDLREPYDASANPPFAYRALPARIIVKCHVVSPASIGGMRGLNSTLVCLMNVSFVLGKDSYVLTMNRGAYPDINDALVTCTDVSGSPADPNAPCTAWTVDPTMTDPNGARINLARLVLRGKAGKLIDLGRYYMRFHISFRK
jgi:hypothetical protein